MMARDAKETSLTNTKWQFAHSFFLSPGVASFAFRQAALCVVSPAMVTAAAPVSAVTVTVRHLNGIYRFTQKARAYSQTALITLLLLDPPAPVMKHTSWFLLGMLTSSNSFMLWLIVHCPNGRMVLSVRFIMAWR